SLAKRLGHAPSVGIAESREHHSRGRHPERLDELLPQQSQRHGVEQEHPLAGKRDEAPLGSEMQQLMDVEIGRAHGSETFQIDRPSYHFDSFTWSLPVNKLAK